MSKKYDLIIFDLDGTLLDTSQGIFNSVRYSEQQMGFTPILDTRLKEFVGPPPKSMYMKVYNVDEDTAFIAAQKHREYGRTKAVFEATIYPNMIEVLTVLKNSGYRLAVSTLKSQRIAEKILSNFKLDQYFDAIVGMDEKESLTKKMTIELAIKKTGVKGKVLMVGDSQYDYDGAKEAGVDFVGVLYGFGFELQNTYEFNSIMMPNQLIEILS